MLTILWVAQIVKTLPAIQDTWVWALGLEDPLEKGKATYSSILAWKIPWSEEPGRLQSMGLQRVGHDWVINTFTYFFHYYYSHWLPLCLKLISSKDIEVLPTPSFFSVTNIRNFGELTSWVQEKVNKSNNKWEQQCHVNYW